MTLERMKLSDKTQELHTVWLHIHNSLTIPGDQMTSKLGLWGKKGGGTSELWGWLWKSNRRNFLVTAMLVSSPPIWKSLFLYFMKFHTREMCKEYLEMLGIYFLQLYVNLPQNKLYNLKYLNNARSILNRSAYITPLVHSSVLVTCYSAQFWHFPPKFKLKKSKRNYFNFTILKTMLLKQT